jgi:CheY-like chemotaxis protein
MANKSKTRILVVEDDVTVRLTISKLLDAEGYDVSAANDGFDALLHLQHTIPNLILSDLKSGITTSIAGMEASSSPCRRQERSERYIQSFQGTPFRIPAHPRLRRCKEAFCFGASRGRVKA